MHLADDPLPYSKRAGDDTAMRALHPRCVSSIKRVLVVDDNVDFANLLADELRESHEVRVAHDGSMALELIVEYAPDLVVSDLALPGINGWELARRVRKLNLAKQPHLVAMSAMDMEPHRFRSARVGYESHIGKPFRIDHLRDIIAHLALASR